MIPNRRLRACFAALAVSIPAALVAEVRVDEGIVYAIHGGEEMRLDIARPDGDGDMRAAIVCIHGGGWRAGDRSAYGGFIRELAEAGYVAATVSYRLTERATWPAQLDDVKAAVRWLRENAAKYGLDPERIGATGASAGGHLSLMLGVLPGAKTRDPAGVQAVVNLFGPADLTIAEFEPRVDELVEALAGGKRAEKADVIRELSPVTHITPGDAPVLTFHGDQDRIVPVHQARVLHEALEKARVPNRLEVLEGRDHGWGGEELERTKRETIAFFDRHLRPAPDQPLLVAEDFTDGSGRWEPKDPSVWEVREEGGDRYLALARNRSSYKPKVRSPVLISLLEDVTVTDFLLDVRLQSTIPEYGHQDLVLVFGYQDPERFYYVHFGRQADAHANSVFVVDGSPRLSIAKERTEGTAWSTGWHHARIRRDAESGRIEVFFDDMTKPAMVAEDRRFAWGRVGIGSFDDTGSFDAVRLWGKRKE